MKIILFIICFLFSILTSGQEVQIPMEAAYWEYDSTRVEFITHRSITATKGIDGPYQIFLKNHIFTNGTLEFDVELIGMGFPGINFRMSEDRENGENFYIRSFGEVTPEMRTTLQYAALIDGMSIWDLTDEYQAGTNIYQEGWNHIKLVVNGKQMRAYVNDMEKPALIIPELESWRESGGISLSGNVIYANFEIKPDVTEGLNPESGYTSTINDTRYLRNWKVTEAIEFPIGQDLKIPLPSMYGKIVASDLPDSATIWKPLKAESRAMVNLSRNFGLAKENDARRLAWLKCTITSESVQERVLSLGFSDEIWVFINGQLLYTDKNIFGTPQQKEPGGRCTIENTSFKLPLKEGDNEILIGLANYFYGWGLVARLDKTDGITLK